MIQTQLNVHVSNVERAIKDDKDWKVLFVWFGNNANTPDFEIKVSRHGFPIGDRFTLAYYKKNLILDDLRQSDLIYLIHLLWLAYIIEVNPPSDIYTNILPQLKKGAYP